MKSLWAIYCANKRKHHKLIGYYKFYNPIEVYCLECAMFEHDKYYLNIIGGMREDINRYEQLQKEIDNAGLMF